MKRMATAVALVVLLTAPAAMARGPWFGWTISNSTTNPLSNTGPIGAGPSSFAGNLYLWMYCSNNTTGMAAFECDIATTPSNLAPTGFTGLNTVLNAGGPTNLLLAVGGCKMGPFLAGVFSVGPDALIPDIGVCIVKSAANNRAIVVECGQTPIQIVSIGFQKSGPAACADLNIADCTPTAVERTSWGQIKGLYK